MMNEITDEKWSTNEQSTATKRPRGTEVLNLAAMTVTSSLKVIQQDRSSLMNAKLDELHKNTNCSCCIFLC